MVVSKSRAIPGTVTAFSGYDSLSWVTVEFAEPLAEDWFEGQKITLDVGVPPVPVPEALQKLIGVMSSRAEWCDSEEDSTKQYLMVKQDSGKRVQVATAEENGEWSTAHHSGMRGNRIQAQQSAVTSLASYGEYGFTLQPDYDVFIVSWKYTALDRTKAVVCDSFRDALKIYRQNKQIRDAHAIHGMRSGMTTPQMVVQVDRTLEIFSCNYPECFMPGELPENAKETSTSDKEVI